MKYLPFYIISPLESPNAGSREEKERNGGSGPKQIKETDLTLKNGWKSDCFKWV